MGWNLVVKNNEMIVCGIDIGLATTGWSILEKGNKFKNGARIVDYGVIETQSGLSLPARLNSIFYQFNQIIDRYSPEHVAVESLFYFKNQKTVIDVSQSRGVVLLASEIKGLSSFDYTPLQVKTSVTGYGRATKEQVQKMIKMIFGLESIPKPDDAADAIAIAYCHLNTIRIT